MSRTTVALVGIVILSVGILAAWSVPQGDDPAVLLRAAIEKEEVDGNLDAAIEQYKHIIKIAGANRAVAAQALLRLGGCYEKRGPVEARRTYEQLIRDYGEQGREVAAARQRLAVLQSRAAVVGRPEITVRRVFAIEGRGLGTDAAIDPRATFFSCTDPKTGDLAIMELPGGSTRRLTNKGASSDVTQVSVPSPDGRHVAFDWWVVESSQPSGTLKGRLKVRPQLRVTGLDGSAPRVIYESTDASPLYPDDWSPDGGRVLAVHVLRKERVNQVVLLSAGDGSKRVVATVPGFIQSVSRARFSPDGRYIAFDQLAEGSGGLHDIFLVTSDGGRTTPLVQQAGDDLLLDWSPDGRHILFSSDRTGTTDAWPLQVADGKPQRSAATGQEGSGPHPPHGDRAERVVLLQPRLGRMGGVRGHAGPGIGQGAGPAATRSRGIPWAQRVTPVVARWQVALLVVSSRADGARAQHPENSIDGNR